MTDGNGTVRLTVAQALVRFLARQHTERGFRHAPEAFCARRQETTGEKRGLAGQRSTRVSEIPDTDPGQAPDSDPLAGR